jgi:molybdopterin synthase sulfur carrier subunit
MIRVLYFASLREQVGTGTEELPVGDSHSVSDVRDRLRARGGAWAEALAPERQILTAVNQAMAKPDARIEDGDEIAFFPPVTGG